MRNVLDVWRRPSQLADMTNADAPMMQTRSWLFTPATRPERFGKAAEAGADVLILDIEDAVAPADKAHARLTAIATLRESDTGVARALRINALDTPAGIADLDALLAPRARLAGLEHLVLPKTESAAHMAILDRLLTTAGLPTRLIALIESARGLACIDEIATSTPRLAGLMLGAADMAADLGCEPAWEPLAPVRAALVRASALGRIMAIDSPFLDIRDSDGLALQTSRAVALGFAARAAIHPAQVATINDALTPSTADIERARRILAENERGVGVIDGQMIDEAVARKARRMLAAAGHG